MFDDYRDEISIAHLYYQVIENINTYILQTTQCIGCISILEECHICVILPVTNVGDLRLLLAQASARRPQLG